MCWLELSKGFITNNLFVKRILFCSWNIHERSIIFSNVLVVWNAPAVPLNEYQGGLAANGFSCWAVWSVRYSTRVDRGTCQLCQQHAPCANRCVCVSVAAGLPLVDARETFETCFLQAFILLKCDRSANSRGGVNNAGANPLKIQMSVQWVKDILHPVWLALAWPSRGAVSVNQPHGDGARIRVIVGMAWVGAQALAWRFPAREMLLTGLGLFSPSAWLRQNRMVEGKDSKLCMKLCRITPLNTSSLMLIFVIIISTSVEAIASGCRWGSTGIS